MPRRRAVQLCEEKGCKNQQTTKGFCRLHYLKNWRKLQESEKKKAADNLNKYVDYLAKKNPDRYVNELKDDLKSNSDFQQKADNFVADSEFYDVLDELDMGSEVKRILGSIKVDKSF